MSDEIKALVADLIKWAQFGYGVEASETMRCAAAALTAQADEIERLRGELADTRGVALEEAATVAEQESESAYAENEPGDYWIALCIARSIRNLIGEKS